jgi:hypothetical protein
MSGGEGARGRVGEGRVGKGRARREWRTRRTLGPQRDGQPGERQGEGNLRASGEADGANGAGGAGGAGAAGAAGAAGGGVQSQWSRCWE